jgi:hypothetical protein
MSDMLEGFMKQLGGRDLLGKLSANMGGFFAKPKGLFS